jgi:hypothetical protein
MISDHSLLRTRPAQRMRLVLATTALMLGIALPQYGWAQLLPEALATQTEGIAAQAEANTVEPEALAALQAMGAFLASLDTFGLHSDFSTEFILDNDQSIEVDGQTDYLVDRPTGLKVELSSDFGSREFYYDGKTLVVVSPSDNAYGAVDAGSTIKEMLESVSYHLGIEVPLADVFDWGTDDAPTQAITEGFFVNTVALPDDSVATHWAFRTEEKDFQVWIQDGEQPLLRRILIKDKTQPGQPAFEANLTWDLKATPTAADFTYTPPEDATDLQFLDLSAQAEEARQ